MATKKNDKAAGKSSGPAPLKEYQPGQACNRVIGTQTQGGQLGARYKNEAHMDNHRRQRRSV